MRLLLFVILLLIPLTAAAKGPNGFALQWQYPTGDALPQGIVKDAHRPYLYVAAKTGGLLVLDVSDAHKASAVATVPIGSLSGLDAMKVVQAGDYLYLALGDLFDARGQKAGVAIVDISNPRKPAVTSLRVTDQKLHGSADILVSGDYAYLAAMDKGVFIFDISNKANIQLVSSILPDPDFPRRNPGSVQRPNARGLALRGNALFVADDAGGLRAIDVSDKARPRENGRYINTAMMRKQQAYNNLVLHGNLAYVAVDYCGLEVVDISDIGNMRQVGWYNPWRCDAVTNIWFNSGGHTNQLALDPQRPIVYVSGGDSELLAVDVSNPAEPRLAATYGGAKDGFGTWGLAAQGPDIYLAYMKAMMPFRGIWSGIRALTH